VLKGSRRLALLARTAFAGLRSLLTPRLGSFRPLVDCRRKAWLPRLVNLDPSIPVELAAAGREVLPLVTAGLAVLMVVDLREIVMVLLTELFNVCPASLVAALVQRPSISPLRFIAQLSKSSEAEAGRAAATNRSRNSGTNDSLM